MADAENKETEAQLLSFEDIMNNIREALEEADGEFVANTYNSVCSASIEYNEDNSWKVEE